ncbi:hypothetical protein [Maribellus sp. YY47]|uniref:hypothetical protein n=1 Tax=Maribellus sp. YY47 TaxID=2929486 RepID=UPI002001A4F2|nr:hypothetical protein [Maribellus sp. YY47]MCK3683175.1 hypothetical protein [Maribellus sp. YY47]
MKKKIILPVVIILIVVVFVANGIYGNKIAKEIDTQLKAKISQSEAPVSVSYAKVKVNPLFSKVKMIDVSVSDLNRENMFRCKTIAIDIPYGEALSMLDSTEFKEINSFGLTLVQPEILRNDSVLLAMLDDITIDFNGHLTKADFQNLAERFPDQNQELQLSFSGLKAHMPGDLYKQPAVSELLNQFTEIDKGSYTIVYMADSGELDIKEFSIKSPVLSYTGNATFKFDGKGMSDFMPERTKMEASLILHPKDFEWEDKNGNKGKFSMDKLRFDTNSTVLFANKGFPEGEMKLEVVNLSVHNSGGKENKGASRSKISFNNFDIEKLDVNYRLNDKKLSITNTQIKSSLLDADVFADVDMDPLNPANSAIKEATVKVKNLAPELEEMLKTFEQYVGKDVPREDDVIVLELSGKLARPTIKGFEF